MKNHCLKVPVRTVKVKALTELKYSIYFSNGRKQNTSITACLFISIFKSILADVDNEITFESIHTLLK